MTTTLCSYPGCENLVLARGFCNGHYRQLHQGRELAPLKPRISDTVVREHSPEIVRLWQDQRLSTGQISDRVGLSRGIVRRVIQRAGLYDSPRQPRLGTSTGTGEPRTVQAGRQERTTQTAKRSRAAWTSLEVQMAVRDDMSLEQIAQHLGRTYAAIDNVRRAVADPEHPAHQQYKGLLGGP